MQTVAGIVLVVLGVLLVLAGVFGIVRAALNQPGIAAAGFDWGAFIGALAAAPGYVVALLFGTWFIYWGFTVLGLPVPPIPGMPDSTTPPTPTASPSPS